MASARTIEILNKVPQVTVFFWSIKVLATTVGETFADFLNVKLGLGLVATSYAMTALFVVALIVQLRRRRYVPAIYWIVVVLISVVGTLLSDNLHDRLGVPLLNMTIIFAILLAVIFVAWFRSERTLSVHSITTTRRELYYWSAILVTFALGTSAGDFISEATGFGYATAALMFAGIIALIAIAHFAFKADGILSFWLAYILTRPLGAAMGDLLSQPHKAGGLAVGTTVTSVVFLTVILGLVIFITKRPDVENSIARA